MRKIGQPRKYTGKWKIVLINRPGLDGLYEPEVILKREFDSAAEARQYARRQFGNSRHDHAGWRVEKEQIKK